MLQSGRTHCARSIATSIEGCMSINPPSSTVTINRWNRWKETHQENDSKSHFPAQRKWIILAFFFFESQPAQISFFFCGGRGEGAGCLVHLLNYEEMRREERQDAHMKNWTLKRKSNTENVRHLSEEKQEGVRGHL